MEQDQLKNLVILEVEWEKTHLIYKDESFKFSNHRTVITFLTIILHYIFIAHYIDV